MQYLDFVWKVALVVIPILLNWYRSQRNQSQEALLLLQLADAVWTEVEAWKSGHNGPISSSDAEAAAFNRIEAIRKAQRKTPLSDVERATLHEFWQTKSKGAHLPNSFGRAKTVKP